MDDESVISYLYIYLSTCRYWVSKTFHSTS